MNTTALINAPKFFNIEKNSDFVRTQPSRFNLILAADSYKSSHAFAYPKNIHGMASYIEARTSGRHTIVPFGAQAMIDRYLSVPINQDDIDEAAKYFEAHGDPFNREVWEHILEAYDGYMPLTIRAVPEGTPVRSGNAILTITCVDTFVGENIFWLCSYFETLILRGIWYPTTIASMDRDIKMFMKSHYEMTGADMNLLPFAFHDFGGRGVTCHEQAEIGGASHMVSFMGSDTNEGIMYVNRYYDEPMAGFSVPATEHSVQCSFGKGSYEDELNYLKSTIENLGKPGGIVSIVIDGYDVYRAAKILCTDLKDLIISSGCKVVFRPDSGDMNEVIPKLLKMQEEAFGSVTNAQGYRKINYVGIIQGDGVDHNAIKTVMRNTAALGYSSDNVIFGSGGALLQKVNRDTYKFAQKASAVLMNTKDGYKWFGIAKDPITDPGKKSKEGVLTLTKSLITGEQQTMRVDQGPINAEFKDMMVTVFDHGVMFNFSSLAQIRERAKI